jgi:hypothetical protein
VKLPRFSQWLLVAALTLLLAPLPASADTPEDWEFHVSSYPGPLQGACGATLEARGWSFPARLEVAVGLLHGDDFVELSRVTTTDNGFFVFDLHDPYPADCAPGNVLLFAARVIDDGGFLGDETGPFEVIVPLELHAPSPARLAITPSAVGHCEALSIVGTGFPPEADLLLLYGEATPFAHEFAEFARATTAPDGSFEVITDFFVPGCEPGRRLALFAFVVTGPKGTPDPAFPRASAIFTVGAPDPASAGNAALAASRTSRGVAIFLTLSTVLLLAVSRRLTAGSRT